MRDRGDDDAVSIEHEAGELPDVELPGRKRGQPARLRGIVGRQDLHAGHPLEPLGPAVAQEAQPGGLPLRTDAVQKIERFDDRIVIGRGVRADLLELAHVLVHLGRGRHHRPDLRDLGATDVQESGTDRRREPLVQARPVVIAIQLVAREREMRVRVRSIYDHFNTARSAQLADLLHREDLPGEVRDVADVDDLGTRRDRGFDPSRQIIL